jgi:ketosteroid isomerase-like protein
MSERDEIEDVRRAHQGFYRAFETLRIEKMDEVWAHDGQVTCLHPGWPIAEGWAEVRASWETIFRNSRDMRFDVGEERIDVRGDMAWVVCVERLTSAAGSGAVQATNVLRREDGAWRMVHHHGSTYVRPARRSAPPPLPSESGGKKRVLN